MDNIISSVPPLSGNFIIIHGMEWISLVSSKLKNVSSESVANCMT